MTSLTTDFPPSINVSGLPPDEQTEAWLVSSCLAGLDQHVSNFRAALTLFDFCLANSRVLHETMAEDEPSAIGAIDNWPLVAARDATITIYHFGTSLQAIRAALSACPTLGEWVDASVLREVSRQFRGRFPEFVALRHGVSHAAELTKDRPNFQRNAFSGDYSGPGIKITKAQNLMLQNCLLGRQFTTTFKGKIVSFDLSQDNLVFLEKTKAAYYDAFWVAKRKSAEAARKVDRTSP